MRLGFIKTFAQLRKRNVYGKGHLLYAIDHVTQDNIVHLAIRSHSPKMLQEIYDVLGADIRRIIDEPNRANETPEDVAMYHPEMAAQLELIRKSASYLTMGVKPKAPEVSAISVAHLKVLERRHAAANLPTSLDRDPPVPKPTEADEARNRASASAPVTASAAGAAPAMLATYRDFSGADDAASPDHDEGPAALQWQPVLLCGVAGVFLFALCFFFACSIAASDAERLKKRHQARYKLTVETRDPGDD